ncbi:MAG: CAP family protein [Acidocella sp.]|nr:CAP family protein [Acidocella sp.]
MKRIAIAALAAVILGGPAHAQADPGSIAELLAAHNAYRGELGLQPLRWSDELEAKAQSWADHLAEIGQLQHSGSGQNLAMASAGTQSLTQLVDLWGGERADFTNGDFPDISTTGNWVDVGHYSQMVWKATTEVGCGFAENYGRDVLVCDYDPPGNVMGERAY